MTLNFTSCVSNENIIFIKVSFASSNKKIFEKYTKINSYIDAYDISKGIDNIQYYDLSNCQPIIAYLPIDLIQIDTKKYQLYEMANINIYKPDDEAFKKSCYITKGLKYDLTQKFRRMEIYENYTFISDDCTYDSINIEFEKIKFNCKYKDNFDYSYSFEEKHLNISLHKVDNLVLKCISYVEHIEKNIGFYLYFIFSCIIVLGLIQSIINFYYKYFKNNKALNPSNAHETENIINTENNEQ